MRLYLQYVEVYDKGHLVPHPEDWAHLSGRLRRVQPQACGLFFDTKPVLGIADLRQQWSLPHLYGQRRLPQKCWQYRALTPATERYSFIEEGSGIPGCWDSLLAKTRVQHLIVILWHALVPEKYG